MATVVDPTAAIYPDASVATGSDDDDDDEAASNEQQRKYGEDPITDDDRQDYPSIFTDEVDEIIDILTGKGKYEQINKLRRDLRNCRDWHHAVDREQENCELAKQIMDQNKIFEKTKGYKNEISIDKIKMIKPKHGNETDDEYERRMAEDAKLLDEKYEEALKIGYKNTDYHTNKYRAGYNATTVDDNFKPYFALELMYELIEMQKKAYEKEYNKHVVKKVKHSRYRENSFAIFPYKRRLSDLLTNQCRKSDLINWKSVIESEYKLHRHNPNPMEKSLEDDYMTDAVTYKKNISRKQMMDFYLYMNADLDERRQNKANSKRAEMLRLAFKYFDREELLNLEGDPLVTLTQMGELIDEIIGTKSGYSISLANSIRLIPDRILNQGKEGTTLKKIGNAIGITSRSPISREDQDAAAIRAGEREERNRTHNFFGFRRSSAYPNASDTPGNFTRANSGTTTLGGKKTKFKKVIKFKTRKRH